MTNLTCDVARDRMPEMETGVLSPDEALQLERHLAECGACAAERAVVALVRASVPVPPPGLDARIRRAVRRDAVAAARPRTAPSFAVAAGVAFVLLTGSLLMRTGLLPGGGGEPASVDEVTLGWPQVSDPILRTVPVLNDLSVEELESLLAEMES